MVTIYQFALWATCLRQENGTLRLLDDFLDERYPVGQIFHILCKGTLYCIADVAVTTVCCSCYLVSLLLGLDQIYAESVIFQAQNIVDEILESKEGRGRPNSHHTSPPHRDSHSREQDFLNAQRSGKRQQSVTTSPAGSSMLLLSREDLCNNKVGGG